MSMTEFFTAVLMLFGAGFMLLASVGVVRLPDLFIRMHAGTKSGTLGVSGMLLAAAIHFNDLGVTARSLMTVVFIFLTAPVAACMIGRAAYSVGVPLYEGSVVDEAKGRVHLNSMVIQSGPDKPAPPEGDAK